MIYKIVLDKEAEKFLDKLDSFMSRRIIKKIKELQENPFSKDVKRLKGYNQFRLRIGDYRAIFSIEKDTIQILKIGHRKNIHDAKYLDIK